MKSVFNLYKPLTLKMYQSKNHFHRKKNNGRIIFKGHLRKGKMIFFPLLQEETMPMLFSVFTPHYKGIYIVEGKTNTTFVANN